MPEIKASTAKSTYCSSFIYFSVKIAPGAVVCDECELHGDITIGMYFLTYTLCTIK